MSRPHAWTSQNVEDSATLLRWLIELDSGTQQVFSVQSIDFAGGAKADGSDDAPALNAAFAAAASTNTVAYSPPGKTYTVKSTLTLPANLKLDFNNSTIKRDASVTGTAVINIDANGGNLQNLVIDGNSGSGANGNGLRYRGSGWTFRNVIIQNCFRGAGWSIEFNGFHPDATWLNCQGNSNTTDLGTGASSDGFIIFAGKRLIFRECSARGNTRYGFSVESNGSTSADHPELTDCTANDNFVGFEFGNNLNYLSADNLLAENNLRYGVYFNNGTAAPSRIRVGRIDARNTGNSLSWGTDNTGTGVQIVGLTNSSIGTIHSVDNRGYGVLLSAASTNDFGTVLVDQTNAGDGDPGVSLQSGSVHNHFGSVAIVAHTYGFIIGEGTTGNDFNSVGILRTTGCSFGALRVDGGNYNHVDRIVSRNSFTTDATYTGLVDFSTANATNNIVGFVDNRATGTKPKYVVHFDGSCLSNLVLDGISRSDFVTAATNGSGVGGNVTSPALSAAGSLR